MVNKFSRLELSVKFQRCGNWVKCSVHLGKMIFKNSPKKLTFSIYRLTLVLFMVSGTITQALKD